LHLELGIGRRVLDGAGFCKSLACSKHSHSAEKQGGKKCWGLQCRVHGSPHIFSGAQSPRGDFLVLRRNPSLLRPIRQPFQIPPRLAVAKSREIAAGNSLDLDWQAGVGMGAA
jgi:hypothetical protein